MSSFAVTVLSFGSAVALAIVWLYFFGSGTGSRLEHDTHTVVSSPSDRVSHPPVEMPEVPVMGSDRAGGTVSPRDRRPEPSHGGASRPRSSQVIVEDHERWDTAEPIRHVKREIARTFDRGNEPKKADTPRGDLAISGRVLMRAGTPVSGIELTAMASHLFDRERGKLVLAHSYRRKTTSAYDGSYEFRQLADGEYHIRTTETEQYAEAHISVRAGVDFADLVLVEQRDLRVHGVVSSSLGEPLDGAKVQPGSQSGQTVSTNQGGEYAFEVKALETARSLLVRASKEGYKDQKIPLEVADADQDVELNIVLEPEATALAAVSGTVRSSTGAPIVGQRVQLSSGKVGQSYRATSDKDGKFVMQDVETSDDYMLSINAPDAYKDYFQRNLRVTEDGLTLNIELKAKDVGTLHGQMVDLYGNPISNFSLVLQTKKASYYNARIVGDSVGAFTVENAPAGELRFKTKSNPHHRIEGIRLDVGGERDVVLVLDSGYAEINGRVLDDRGYPIAVPNISLTWSHEKNGLRSSSRRTTAADEKGDFHFTQLGPGQHTIAVNAPGFKPVRFRHDADTHGFEVVVRLERQKNKGT